MKDPNLPFHVVLCENLVQKRSQKFKVMKLENFERDMRGGLFGGKISDPFFSGNIGLKFVTETSPHSSHNSSQ